MVVKVYISGISGNKDVKKRQQRVSMILESKHIDYVCIDITEPGNEAEKERMQTKSNAKDAKYPLPPQMFNEEDYCGDYEEFDLANENDELEKFLKVAPSVSKAAITLNTNEEKGSGDATNKTLIENGQVNGNTSSRENSAEKESVVVLEERRADPNEGATEENVEEADEEEEEEAENEQ